MHHGKTNPRETNAITFSNPKPKEHTLSRYKYTQLELLYSSALFTFCLPLPHLCFMDFCRVILDPNPMFLECGDEPILWTRVSDLGLLTQNLINKPLAV
ncbi:hypothetical protein I3760_04G115800 [Carya illinoinensis]|nr:hypothetical protein I3760_04G115800 [Carya illinoinensis]